MQWRGDEDEENKKGIYDKEDATEGDEDGEKQEGGFTVK